MKDIIIYTDGACSGNPGKGGYGAILMYKDFKKELSAGYKLTTNNRMEMLACIKAFEALKEPCNITLYSDSKYVIDSITKGWAEKWQKNNWKKGSGLAKNPDLWEILLGYLKIHNVKFIWVKGHNDNPGNERCDFLARQAATSNNLLEDKGYK